MPTGNSRRSPSTVSSTGRPASRTPAGQVVLMLGVAIAAFGHRALARWIAATGILVVAAEFSPVGFLASLVFLAWAAVAGIVLAVGTERARVAAGQAAVPVS
jgi:hypothetical protein